MRATRILLVAPAPPRIGGQAVQAQRLLENLRREPHLHVELMSIAPRFFPRLQRIRYVRTVVTTAKYVFDLFRKTPGADIVHVFAASYFAFLLTAAPAILIARLFGKKVIVNYRSGEAEQFFGGWGRHWLWIVRLADEVVSPSGYLVDVFARFGIRARSILNVIESGTFTFRDREILRPVFLSNRILEPLYNIDCILRAYRILLDKFPDARLIVCNDGPERERLERAARTLKLSNVEFIGRIPHSKIGDVYDMVDVYLNSPNFDCMPGSLIECFASGVPVVSTRAGGIPYIVTDGETGLLVNTDDHEALAARAVYLLENPSAARAIIEKARRECARYTWAAIRPHWLELYDRLAARPTQADRGAPI